MAKISASRAAMMFEEIIGWPYVTPGTCDNRGIDCSGAWARVYRAHGMAIDHGSNSQYRKFCDTRGKLSAASQLRVGMAVFKCRPWRDEDRQHSQYGQEPGNMYHVGCVTSVSPLRIVHATPDFAKADTAIGQWAYWGLLKGVEYDDIKGAPPPAVPAESYAGKTVRPANLAPGTTTVNLRQTASAGARILRRIPLGTAIQCVADDGEWCECQMGDQRGYVMRKFLAADG